MNISNSKSLSNLVLLHQVRIRCFVEGYSWTHQYMNLKLVGEGGSNVSQELSIYLNNAKNSLTAKNLVNFVSNIAVAKYLAKDNDELLGEVLFEEAGGLYKLQEYANAHEVICQALANQFVTGEKRTELLRKKGIVLGKLGSYKEALSIFQELSQNELPRVRILGLINLAWIYVYLYQRSGEQRYLTKARVNCEEAISIFQVYTDPVLEKEVLVNLGNAYWYAGDPENALKTFLDAHRLGEEDPKILNNIAAAYVSLGDGHKAREYLRKAELLAEDTKNYFELAQSNLIHGRMAEKLLEDYMQAKDAYLVAFDCFIQSNALPESCKCLDSILQLNQRINSESMDLLARHLKSQISGNFGKAEDTIFSEKEDDLE